MGQTIPLTRDNLGQFIYLKVVLSTYVVKYGWEGWKEFIFPNTPEMGNKHLMIRVYAPDGELLHQDLAWMDTYKKVFPNTWDINEMVRRAKVKGYDAYWQMIQPEAIAYRQTLEAAIGKMPFAKSLEGVFFSNEPEEDGVIWGINYKSQVGQFLGIGLYLYLHYEIQRNNTVSGYFELATDENNPYQSLQDYAAYFDGNEWTVDKI